MPALDSLSHAPGVMPAQTKSEILHFVQNDREGGEERRGEGEGEMERKTLQRHPRAPPLSHPPVTPAPPPLSFPQFLAGIQKKSPRRLADPLPPRGRWGKNPGFPLSRE